MKQPPKKKSVRKHVYLRQESLDWLDRLGPWLSGGHGRDPGVGATIDFLVERLQYMEQLHHVAFCHFMNRQQ